MKKITNKKILIVNVSKGYVLMKVLKKLENFDKFCILRGERNKRFSDYLKSNSIKYSFIKTKKNPSNEILYLAKKWSCYYIFLIFNKILKGKILKVFNNRIFNLHPSLLPKYRGLQALERSMQSSDKYIGYSIHKVINKVDFGKVLLQIKILKANLPKNNNKRDQIFFNKRVLILYKFLRTLI